MNFKFTVDSVASMSPSVFGGGTVTWTGPLAGTHIGTAPPQTFFDTEGVGEYDVSSTSDLVFILFADSNVTAFNAIDIDGVSAIELQNNNLISVPWLPSQLDVDTFWFFSNPITSFVVPLTTRTTTMKIYASTMALDSVELNNTLSTLFTNRNSYSPTIVITLDLRFQTTGAKVNGIYREPDDHNAPTSEAEMMWVLENDYGWIMSMEYEGVAVAAAKNLDKCNTELMNQGVDGGFGIFYEGEVFDLKANIEHAVVGAPEITDIDGASSLRHYDGIVDSMDDSAIGNPTDNGMKFVIGGVKGGNVAARWIDGTIILSVKVTKDEIVLFTNETPETTLAFSARTDTDDVFAVTVDIPSQATGGNIVVTRTNLDSGEEVSHTIPTWVTYPAGSGLHYQPGRHNGIFQEAWHTFVGYRFDGGAIDIDRLLQVNTGSLQPTLLSDNPFTTKMKELSIVPPVVWGKNRANVIQSPTGKNLQFLENDARIPIPAGLPGLSGQEGNAASGSDQQIRSNQDIPRPTLASQVVVWVAVHEAPEPAGNQSLGFAWNAAEDEYQYLRYLNGGPLRFRQRVNGQNKSFNFGTPYPTEKVYITITSCKADATECKAWVDGTFLSTQTNNATDIVAVIEAINFGSDQNGATRWINDVYGGAIALMDDHPTQDDIDALVASILTGFELESVQSKITINQHLHIGI